MLCSLAKNSEFLSVSAWQWDILDFFWFEIWSFCTDWTSTEKCPIHFSLFEVLSVHCSNISVAGTHIASKRLRLIIFCCEFSADPFNSWGAFELKTIIVCYGRGTLPLVSLTPCLKARFSLAKFPELGHWSVCSVKGAWGGVGFHNVLLTGKTVLVDFTYGMGDEERVSWPRVGVWVKMRVPSLGLVTNSPPTNLYSKNLSPVPYSYLF